MRPEQQFEQLSGHPLAFAARGFVKSLNDEQRATFIALFSGSGPVASALEAAVEQAEFERGSAPAELPAPALVSALDYALSRASAAGGIVGDEIVRQWPGLGEATRTAIRQRIRRAVGEGQSGMNVDTKGWIEIARLPVNEAERQDRMSF